MNLEQLFISKISGELLLYRLKGSDAHQFCCPYCQSSGFDKNGKKISESLAKGYFYKKEGSINFKCHKCGTGKQFHNFLKDHFQKEFIAYVKERELRGTTGKGHNCPTLANALKSIGEAIFERPVFHIKGGKGSNNVNREDEEIPSTSNSEDDQSANNRDSDFIFHEGQRYKHTVCPPATTQQALAVHGAPINKIMNRRERMRRQRRGDL